MFLLAATSSESRGLPERCSLISYPWTRVPKDVPPLDPWQLRLLPVADRFMALMWSRPGGLSLRTTWVTPATIWLAVAVVVALGIPGLGAIAYGIATRQVLLAFGGLIAAALGAGGGTVAVYGIRQRLLSVGESAITTSDAVRFGQAQAAMGGSRRKRPDAGRTCPSP